MVGVSVALGVGVTVCRSPVDEPNSTVPAQCQVEPPVIEPQKTDILFVIDNSGSMAEEQAKVAAELEQFVAELKRGGGITHDFHVGVITTSVFQHLTQQTAQDEGLPQQLDYAQPPFNQAGRLLPVPAINVNGQLVPGGDRYLTAADPHLVARFAALVVAPGIAGSGQEMPFEAVRLATTPPLITTSVTSAGNKEFFRDGARLVIIVLTDEDDCSEVDKPPKVQVGNSWTTDYCLEQSAKLTGVEAYSSMFHEMKDYSGAPREVLWTAIAPVHVETKEAASVIGTLPDGGSVIQNAGCTTSRGAGFRHREMSRLFDVSLQNLDSICDSSYQQTLLQIARLANVDQSLSISNVPDGRLLRVQITRATGSVDTCSVRNGGIRYEAGTVLFQANCLRRHDDQRLVVSMLCAS